MENTKFNQNIMYCNLQTFVVDKEKPPSGSFCCWYAANHQQKKITTPLSMMIVKAIVRPII
jgi:hypothetical protein